MPWTGSDLLIFIVFAIGAQVLLEYLLINVAITLGMVKPDPAAMQAFVSGNAAYVTMRQCIWSALMLLFLGFILLPRSRHGFWRTLGWRPVHVEGVKPAALYSLCALAGVPLALTVSVVSGLMQPKTELPIQSFFQERTGVLLLTAMGILVAPLVEETIFRGFLYPVFARRLGVAAGVIVTGTLFGLTHAPQLWGGWAQIGLLVGVGIVFTFARARTGSVATSYFLHLGYNSFLFLGFYIATRGLQQLPAK